MTHRILSEQPEWQALQQEKEKIGRALKKRTGDFSRWDKESRKLKAEWQAQVDRALLEGENPPPQPELPQRPAGRVQTLHWERQRLQGLERELLARLRPVIESEAANREKELFDQVLNPPIALNSGLRPEEVRAPMQVLNDVRRELEELCGLVAKVRGASSPGNLGGLWIQSITVPDLVKVVESGRSFLVSDEPTGTNYKLLSS